MQSSSVMTSLISLAHNIFVSHFFHALNQTRSSRMTGAVELPDLRTLLKKDLDFVD